MILLFLNLFYLFIFVIIVLFLMKRKDSAGFQNIFDHYTRLAVLVTFGLLMTNCVVLLDAGSKLPMFALIALTADLISPFWIPLFLYFIRNRVYNDELKKSLKNVAVISFAFALITYSFLISGFIR